MAAIEYGIDGYGDKIYPLNAYGGRTYICPYCFDEICFVQKSVNRVAHFKHKVIRNRTPLQMMCPGYKGTPDSKRIEGVVDQTYITNGGIPLYLCESGNERYELRAIFPTLTDQTQLLLRNWDVKVVIRENGKSEVYSASYLNSYKLKSNSDWIHLECSNLKYPIDELEEKWRWGIRGSNPDIDIFHSNYEGGYRVALYSNIIIAKEYLILSRSKLIQEVPGITFEYKGSLSLKRQYYREEEYVFSMVVKEASSEALSYIKKRGYQLIEESDEIIPMWPPAIISGKEIEYRKKDKNAYLYHKKRSQQDLFYIGSYGLNRIPERNEIFHVSTCDKTILLSEYTFHRYSNEIRVLLSNQNLCFEDNNYYKPVIGLRDENSTVKDITQVDEELLKDGRVVLSTDYDVMAYVMSNYFVDRSTRKYIDPIKGNNELVIDAGVFGIYKFKISKAEHSGVVGEIEYTKEIDAIRCCKGPLMPVNTSVFKLLEKVQPISEELYLILYSWIQSGTMPVSAHQFIENIMEKK